MSQPNPMIVAMMTVSCLFPICQSGQVCFPFETPDVSTDSSTSVGPQGRPGKFGPAGPPGSKGERGATGIPGKCACNPSEIEQLRDELRNEAEKIHRIIQAPGRAIICGVGMKFGEVRDQQISVSSTHSNGLYSKNRARLDQVGTDLDFGGWLARSCNSVGEWIQVDLLKPRHIVGIVTQGMNYPGRDQYRVTAYKISFGNVTSSLQFIQNKDGSQKIFSGNIDNRESHVINEFPTPITARYFRLIVHRYLECGAIRLEYLVC